tara:strand:+ start:818 stop:1381 length:564 start_codon:yes stop_codon:yes gene_type:complete
MSEKENKELKKKIEKLEDEIIELKEAVDEYDEENDEWRAKFKDLKDEYDVLDSQFIDKLNEIEEDGNRIHELEEEVEKLQKELIKLRLEKNKELIDNIKNMARTQYPYSKFDPTRFPSSQTKLRNKVMFNDDMSEFETKLLQDTYTTEKQNIFLDTLTAKDFVPIVNVLDKSRKKILDEEDIEDLEL